MESAANKLKLFEIPNIVLAKIMVSESKEAAMDLWERHMPEVRRAYRKLALEHHPDRGGDGDTFAEVLDAYKFLASGKFVAPLWRSGAATRNNGVTTQRGCFHYSDPCYNITITYNNGEN